MTNLKTAAPYEGGHSLGLSILADDDSDNAIPINPQHRTYADPAPLGLAPRHMVDEARLALLERAEVFDRVALDLPLDEIEAHAGAMGLVRIRWTVGRSWEFDSDGLEAIAFEIFDQDDETVIDLCAFDITDPNRFGTILNSAPGVGSARLRNLASFFAGKALRVHRTPLAWLQAGCGGATMLCPLKGPAWLANSAGPLQAEDLSHGRELARTLAGLFEPTKIMVARAVA